MTLDELKATAPRSFDKLLVDLIVAVQQGHAPIEVPDLPDMAENQAAQRELAASIVVLATRLQKAETELSVLRAAMAALYSEAARAA